MSHLSFPLPVAVLLRRIFNVLSSLAVSNQYLSMRKDGEAKTGVLEIKGLSLSDRTSIRSAEKLVAASSWPNTGTPNHAVSSFRITYNILFTIFQGSKGSESLLQKQRSHWKPLAFSKDWHVRHTHFISFDEGNEKDPVHEDVDENSIYSPSPPPPRSDPPDETDPGEQPLPPIYELMLHPTLFDPVRKPRNPIVLCHGMSFKLVCART